MRKKLIIYLRFFKIFQWFSGCQSEEAKHQTQFLPKLWNKLDKINKNSETDRGYYKLLEQPFNSQKFESDVQVSWGPSIKDLRLTRGRGVLEIGTPIVISTEILLLNPDWRGRGVWKSRFTPDVLHGWPPRDCMISYVLYIGSETSTYHVITKTGTLPEASTDANVYVVLKGDNGETGRSTFSNSTSEREKFGHQRYQNRNG